MTARTKYAIYGTLFGACFPLAGTFVYAWSHFGSIALPDIVRAQTDSALLWIINTAPLWLGLFASSVGQREDSLRRVIQEREATITSRTKDLEEALTEAEDANRSKSRFLANMSHEIRTPMTAILGYAENLQDANLEPDQHDEAIQIIHGNGKHLLQVINDILDFSKIEAGKMPVERIECAPRAMVADVISLMGIHARRKGLDFHAVCDGPIPETIRSDPTRIRQILLNLVGNAIKFTEHGSVQLKVSLIDEDSDPRIEFRVCDTGIGMSEEQIQRLFHSFSQADDSTSRKYGGTGLGLALCKRLVELMSGHCALESAEGEGSCFSVVLPTGDLTGVALLDSPIDGTDVAASQDAPCGPAASAVLDGCRILVAEDNQVNARLITSILEQQGAEVAVAENGRIAVMLARAGVVDGKPFDIVLMDIQMPVMDGYEATSRLRETGYELPILALTANAMEADRQLCLDAGCDDCATKPINRAELLAQIGRLTGRKSQARRPVTVTS